MRRLTLFVLAAVSSVAEAQQRPTSEIFLAPFSVKDGTPVVGKPVNVTVHAGYNNQPSFTPDGRAMLFTSDRDGGQTDIYRLDVASRVISRVTSTPESEYSATVMPDGKRMSVIRVEADGTQRLWSFAMDGTDPRLVIDALKPVGYHAWVDANTIVTFVLGSPNALAHTDIKTQKSDTLARDIGRSLLPLPQKGGFSFTQRVDSSSVAKTMEWPSKATRDLVAMPKGAQDLAWAGRGMLLTATGTKLWSWRSGATGWTEVGDYASAGMADLSRLAISPDGKWIAIVATAK
jgi:dipeptidyl aminopeptidase/acylaminoacyl peptidase